MVTIYYNYETINGTKVVNTLTFKTIESAIQTATLLIKEGKTKHVSIHDIQGRWRRIEK